MSLLCDKVVPPGITREEPWNAVAISCIEESLIDVDIVESNNTKNVNTKVTKSP